MQTSPKGRDAIRRAQQQLHAAVEEITNAVNETPEVVSAGRLASYANVAGSLRALLATELDWQIAAQLPPSALPVVSGDELGAVAVSGERCHTNGCMRVRAYGSVLCLACIGVQAAAAEVTHG